MGTGMGMPSLSIYVNELIRDYGVQKLIRVGTCGALRAEVKIRNVILAMSASTDSAVNKVRFNNMDYAPTASFPLLLNAYEAAQAFGFSPFVGSVLSSDSFYTEDPDQWKLWAKFGIMGVEMKRPNSIPSRQSTMPKPSLFSRYPTTSSLARRRAPRKGRLLSGRWLRSP